MSDRDWPEDFPHENGNYENYCFRCGETFLGHKRRMTCKKCVAEINAARPSPLPEWNPLTGQAKE